MRFPSFNSYPYSKPQNYDISFQMEVKNLTSKNNLVYIIIPFPIENSYQKLLGRSKIVPATGILKKEGEFKNRFVYWKENLNPKQSKVFRILLRLSVKPRNGILKTPAKQFKLKSDEYIDAKRVQKISYDLVKNISDDLNKIRALNSFVINYLEYGNPIQGLYSSNDALNKKKVDCGGFDTLLAALCIAQKIPARIISGFFVSSHMHAWLEIYLPNKGWIPADPSIEKLAKEGRTKRIAKLGSIGSDRIALSVGHNFKIKLDGKVFNLEILQNPKVFSESGDNSIQFTGKLEARRI